MHAIKEHVCIAVPLICVPNPSKNQATCRPDVLSNHYTDSNNFNLTASGYHHHVQSAQITSFISLPTT